MQEEKVIELLKANKLNPSKRTLGGKLSIVSKLVEDYTFTVRPHKYKPGLLSANLKKGDVLAIWDELDENSLPHAVDYVRQVTQLDIQPKQKQPLFNPTVIFLSSVIAFFGLAVGGGLYLTSNSCKYQQPNPSFLR